MCYKKIIRFKRGYLYKKGKIITKGEFMARRPKEYMNTSFFHIMVQGINKEYIFNNSKDRKNI